MTASKRYSTIHATATSNFWRALLCTMLLQIPVWCHAQNMNITGGGITIAAGTGLSMPGNITVASTATITNNSNIFINGNWTNNGGTYTGSGGTVIFRGGSTQAINGTAPVANFNNVVINQSPAANVAISTNVVLNALTFTNGKLTLGNNQLTIGGVVTNNTAGGLTGSNGSSIVIGTGNNAGNLSFDQTTDGSTNVLKSLALNSSASATIVNKLSIDAGSNTQPGTLSLGSNTTLNTNDLLTLKSNANGTARVAPIPVNGLGVALATINGKVTVERFISARRAWRMICVPLQHTTAAETSIWNAWQEGANNTIDLTVTGNYATDNQNPKPGYGTHVTCDRNTYNAAATGFDAASRFGASLLIHNGTDWGGRPLNTFNTYVTSQRGWMLFVRGSRAVNLAQGTYSTPDVTTLRAKGLLFTGNQSMTTATNPSGYNLVNNPFASSIDLTQCTLNGTPISNIGYYVWDPYILGAFNTVGGYTYYDPVLGFLTAPVSPVAANRIEAGTAFFVPSSAGQTLVIPEAAKVANNALVMRPGTSNPASIKTSLYIDQNGSTAQADACGQILDAAFSNAFDETEDRRKMNNFSESIAIFSDATKMVMDYRKPFTDNDTVFYRINRMGIKQYQLLFEPANIEVNGLMATLEDSFTGERTPISLSQPTSVPFSVTADSMSSATNRFRLVFKQANVLPVRFTIMYANRVQKDVQVNWQVQQQINIQQYEVEHSMNGTSFELLGTVNANGTTAAINYKWLHAAPAAGLHYYRIKSIGFDGSTHLSKVVTVNITTALPAFVVSPNPAANNQIFLQTEAVDAGKYVVELLNSAGQLVYNNNIVLAGTSRYSIQPTTALPTGIYQLKVTGQGGSPSIITVHVQ